MEKIPETLGIEKEEEVSECRGHEARRSAYSRFTVDGRKKEVDHELCCDKSINPLTIKTWTVDPHPAWASWIMVFGDTSYVATEYKHVDNAKGCDNFRKVRKKVGGIKKAEVIAVLESLKTTLIGAQKSKEWDAHVEGMHARMLDRIENRICPPITFQYTWSSAPTFTTEQLERFRNRGQTNAEVAEVGRRMKAFEEITQKYRGNGRVVGGRPNKEQLSFLQELPSLPGPRPMSGGGEKSAISGIKATQASLDRMFKEATLTPLERFEATCGVFGASFPSMEELQGERVTETSVLIRSIDTKIYEASEDVTKAYEGLKAEHPIKFQLMEKVVEGALSVAQVAALFNPYTAVATGAVMAAAWVKGKISEGLKELGFEKSCDKLSAVIMLAAESKATKGGGKTAAGSTAFNGLVEKVSHKFESVSGKFHPEPIVWTAPTGTGQTYKVFQRTDIEWNFVRTSGAREYRGMTNLEAARKGIAPILSDGSNVQIHHIGQSAKGPLVEVSTKHHHRSSQPLENGKRPFDVLHSQYGNRKAHPENLVDRLKWDSERKSYWKKRAEEIE